MKTILSHNRRAEYKGVIQIYHTKLSRVIWRSTPNLVDLGL
ncbi:hypothetical protein MC7420_5177 [Coleofasciculus chthonoplastes PCC 7420]|uniref:Uncharacterized protein n=1 Tax=Coleofasciculus chthonoplastes PCC 7420 TaxID=118168 RepID=B4W2I2_9CYAN|nr:hypothetical protein MC7420_5177 [Coleofasciculus chthonoplastes PCC 7420]